jgi:hypothetical protein
MVQCNERLYGHFCLSDGADFEGSKSTMASEMNPYTPSPAGLAGDMQPTPTALYFREGNLVWVTDKTVLPARCVKTNQEMVAGDWTGKMVGIIWKPRWIHWLMLAGPIGFAIGVSLTQKTAKISYSLKGKLRRQDLIRRTLALFLLVAYGVGIYWMCEMKPVPKEALLISLAAGFIFIASALFYQAAKLPIKAIKYRNGWFALRGCCPEFLASLPEVPAAAVPPPSR